MYAPGILHDYPTLRAELSIQLYTDDAYDMPQYLQSGDLSKRFKFNRFGFIDFLKCTYSAAK